MLGQCLTMHGGKDSVGTINAATGIQQIDNAHAIPRPLLNLVEVAGVHNQRVVGLLVGPARIAGYRDLVRSRDQQGAARRSKPPEPHTLAHKMRGE